MATGMKAWVAIVAMAFAAVALSALPPGSLELTQRDQLPEQIRFEAVNDDVRRTHAALRATRWSAKFPDLVARAPANGLVLVPPVSNRLTTAGIEQWRQANVSALEALERRDPSMMVGVLWQPIDEGAIDGLPPVGSLNESSIFVGTWDGTPYCFAVDPYAGRVTDVFLRFNAERGLGACRLYAMYGLAGPHLQAWLEAGAMGFAADGPEVSWAGTAPEPEVRTPLFGLRQYPFPVSDVEVEACLAGSAVGCLASATDPEILAWPDQRYVVENSPLSYVERHGRLRAPFAQRDDDLLADLERELGSDAFARFWRSDEPVPAAFSAAFGTEMGDWLVGWVEAEIGLRRAGPSVPARNLLASVFLLTVLAAASTYSAMRRRV